MPDYIEAQELDDYFIRFIQQESMVSSEETCKDLEYIYELSVRYWHTYKVMDINLKKQVSIYLIERCDYESYEIMDIITAIIPLLGLQEVWNKILKDKPKILNFRIVALIDETIDDYGFNVEDPYSNMS